MFAGKKFSRDETLMVGGDQAIPIVDIFSHQGGTTSLLWDDYTWVRWNSGCYTLSKCARPHHSLTPVHFPIVFRMLNHWVWKTWDGAK
jgi:hypothetical protein